jgi:hypothetical protein
MASANVLLLGRTGVDLDAVHHELGMPEIQLFAASGADEARSVLARTRIDHVIMGAGIDLETRLGIVREALCLSDATTVHIKDRITAKAGFIPFVAAVLGGLDDYEMT